MNGQCKLCLNEQVDLQESHFLPAGIYRRLRDETAPYPYPANIPIRLKQVPQLLREGVGRGRRRLIRHTEFALQKLGRNPALIAAHQIGGKKLLGQIGPRPVEYRSGGRRFLPVAGRTFIHSGARLQPPRLTSAAPSTDKTAGPAKRHQVFNALLLAPKLDNKLSQPSH